jgi:hypothetical protein
MSSSTVGKKDVEIEGRFVQLHVGPNGQKEKSDPFYVGWWRWYCNSLLLCFYVSSSKFVGRTPSKRWFPNLVFKEDLFAFSVLLCFLFIQISYGLTVPSELWRQISVVRANKSTCVTLWPCSNWESGTVSISLKLTFFPKSRPGVVQKLRGKLSYINYDYAGIRQSKLFTSLFHD